MVETVSFAFDQAGLHACLDAMSTDDLNTLDFGLIGMHAQAAVQGHPAVSRSRVAHWQTT
jgi:hypothetical protein